MQRFFEALRVARPKRVELRRPRTADARIARPTCQTTNCVSSSSFIRHSFQFLWYETDALLGCSHVDGHGLGQTDGDTLYVDENQHIERGALVCSRYPTPFFTGRALWVGSTDDGDEVDPETPLSIASRCIVFLERDEPDD